MASVQSASPTLAVVIVVDSSITLASEWPRILHDYFPHFFRRLAGENPSSLTHLRLGFITYGPHDYGGSPVFFNRFFALGAINELKDDPSKLAMGRTVTGGSLGMAALEGYAAAIEMFDILKSGVNQKPLRPLNMNESRDKHKEEFSCHLWHFAAGQPDGAKHPLWNSLSTLDTLTWSTVPAELKKRDINCSMLLVCPSPKFSELFSAIADSRLPPWFPTRSHHTVLLSGFSPSPKPKAAVPPTIPAKRPAETPAEQRSPGPKIAKPPSQTASPALAAAKKPIPQSSPLVPPAIPFAPPPSLLPSPSLHSSPPKPLSREPQEPGVIDLTQPTPELAPAAVQNRAQPPKPNQPPALPNTAQAQPIFPPAHSQPTTPQSQLQQSMQPQPQPPSQSPSAGMRQLASADVGEMRAKLQQVESRIRDTQKRLAEAANANNTEEANKQKIILGRQVGAYKRGCEFVEKVVYAKKFVTAAQAQGSSQPPDSALNPVTSQHPTPVVSVTPQATPPMNPHSTPRLATPRKSGITLNQNPMSGMNASSPNINPNSGVSAGPGPSANANANAALLQVFNPTAAQTPPQVGLGGVSTPDAHMRGATPQHGHAHTNSFGTQPPQLPPAVVAAQMKQFAEQRGPTPGNHGLVSGGNSLGTNPGDVGERMIKQWSGTLTWQGTDTARNERKEVRAQVTATATKGDPMVPTWPKVLSLAPAGPAVSMDELHDWIRRHNPVVMHVQATPGTDEHGYGQLIKLLRDKGCYAIANWEIPGNGQLTTNLLIAPFSQGLLGAAFPVTGIPEIPKPRFQLDPAMRQKIFNVLPAHIRNMAEPQLSQAIMQIYMRSFKPMQGGGGMPLPNTAALPRQQQLQQLQQLQQQQHQQQQQQQQQQQHQQRQQPPPSQQHQQQQSADHFLQNPGVNMPSTGSMFGNMGPKQGELNLFVPGSQANAIASGLLAQPTPSQQLQQRQHQQQVHTQQQLQAQQQTQRAMMEMHRALSGGLGAGVGGGLGGGLMNTGGANSALGLNPAGMNPLGMGGNLGSAGIAAANNGLPVGGFRTGSGLGMGVALPVSGTGFGGLSSGTGLDGGGAPVGGGEGAGGAGGLSGVGMAGMPHGAAGSVTLGMYQSFMQRNGEGGQGQ